MSIYTVLKSKMKITLIVAILVGMHVLWDYYPDGIPPHYLLANGDMPGFSNLWGLLTLPLLTWGIISLMQKRVRE
jgi:hypothetical protein